MWNCEKEAELILSNNQGITKTEQIVSFNELPKEIFNTVPIINPLVNYKNSDLNDNLILNGNSIIKVVDTLNNTKYSVKFTLKNNPPNIFYNLILGNKENELNFINPFVLKYTIHNFEEVNQNHFIDFSNFIGKIDRYDFDSFIESVKLKSNKNANKSIQSKIDSEPCETINFGGSGSGGGATPPTDDYQTNGGTSSSSSSQSGSSSGGASSCSWMLIGGALGGDAISWNLAISCNDGSEYILKSSNEDPCNQNPSGIIGVNSGPSNDEKDCINGYFDNYGNCIEPDKIITDELTGKEGCINGLLDETGNFYVKNIFKKFEGESEFDIKIESKVRVYKENGDEVNGVTKPPINNVITIQINSFQMSSNKALQVARTILHEYIHADMFRKLNTKYPTSGDLDFRTTYESFKSGNFKASTQHETMADLYVGEMTNALKNFHKYALVSDYNYLTNNGANPLPDSFYEALAWQGLKQHDVKAYTDLSDSKKEELQNNLEFHLPTTTPNCPNN